MRDFITKIFGDKRGIVAMQVAILLIAIIGCVVLGTEILVLLLVSRQMQSAADTVALAAATAKAVGHPTSYAQDVASVAAATGFFNGQNDATVTINTPYTTSQNGPS